MASGRFSMAPKRDTVQDVVAQTILTDRFNTEIEARILHYKRFVKGKPISEHSRRYEVMLKKMMGNVPHPSEGVFKRVENVPAADYRHRPIVFPDRVDEQLKTMLACNPHIFEAMYPVDPCDRAEIYKGTKRDGQNGQGSCEYMRRRRGPQHEMATKYRYPPTSYSELGWDSKERMITEGLVKSAFVRTIGVEDQFFRHNTVPGMDLKANEHCSCGPLKDD